MIARDRGHGSQFHLPASPIAPILGVDPEFDLGPLGVSLQQLGEMLHVAKWASVQRLQGAVLGQVGALKGAARDPLEVVEPGQQEFDAESALHVVFRLTGGRERLLGRSGLRADAGRGRPGWREGPAVTGDERDRCDGQRDQPASATAPRWGAGGLEQRGQAGPARWAGRGLFAAGRVELRLAAPAADRRYTGNHGVMAVWATLCVDRATGGGAGLRHGPLIRNPNAAATQRLETLGKGGSWATHANRALRIRNPLS